MPPLENHFKIVKKKQERRMRNFIGKIEKACFFLHFYNIIL
jgi:hypothetical protein